MQKQEPIQFNIGQEDDGQFDFQHQTTAQQPEELASLKSQHHRHYRSKYMLLKMVLCYNLSSLYIGYTLFYFNAIKYSEIQQIFHITIDDGVDDGLGEGFFSSLIELGAVFGALSTRFMFKYFTRRQTFLFANIIAFLAGFMVLFQDMRTLLVGRLLQGICVGIYSTITPLTVKELMPVQISGFFGSFFMPSIVLGSLLAYSFPAIFWKGAIQRPSEDYFKFTFGLTLITLIIQTFLLLFVYKNQTPKYLLLNNKTIEAKKLIKKIYREQYQQLIYEQKINGLRRLRKSDGNSQFNKSHKDKINQQKFQTNLQKKTAKQLLSHENYHKEKNKGIQPLDSGRPLQIETDKKPNSPSGRSEQQFIPQPYNFKSDPTSHPPPFPANEEQSDEYSLKYLKQIPIARVFAFQLQIFQQFTGVYVIGLYGREISKQSVPEVYSYLPILLNALRLMASICGIFIITRFGRKRSMIIGTFIVLVSLIGFCIGFTQQREDPTDHLSFLQVLVLLSFIIFTISYSCTLGPITYLYIPQIVQPPTLPFTSSTNWLCAYLMVLLFPIVRQTEQQYEDQQTGSKVGIGFFIFFTVCTAIHLIIIISIMKQTKYKDEMQIRKQYKQIKICQKLSQYYSENYQQQKQQSNKEEEQKKWDNGAKNMKMMMKEQELKL